MISESDDRSFCSTGSVSSAAVTEGAPLRQTHGTTSLQFTSNVMGVKYDFLREIMSRISCHGLYHSVIICVCACSETLSAVYIVTPVGVVTLFMIQYDSFSRFVHNTESFRNGTTLKWFLTISHECSLLVIITLICSASQGFIRVQICCCLWWMNIWETFTCTNFKKINTCTVYHLCIVLFLLFYIQNICFSIPYYYFRHFVFLFSVYQTKNNNNKTSSESFFWVIVILTWWGGI